MPSGRVSSCRQPVRRLPAHQLRRAGSLPAELPQAALPMPVHRAMSCPLLHRGTSKTRAIRSHFFPLRDRLLEGWARADISGVGSRLAEALMGHDLERNGGGVEEWRSKIVRCLLRKHRSFSPSARMPPVGTLHPWPVEAAGAVERVEPGGRRLTPSSVGEGRRVPPFPQPLGNRLSSVGLCGQQSRCAASHSSHRPGGDALSHKDVRRATDPPGPRLLRWQPAQEAPPRRG